MNGIKQHLQEGESTGVEFVRVDATPREIAGHVVAMLNSEGGSIYVGLDDGGRVIGLFDATHKTSSLQKELNSLITPSALFDVSTEEVDGEQVISIVVPQGANTPYMCDGRIMIRNGPSSVPASAAEMHRWLQKEVSETVRWERRPALELTEEELDLKEIGHTTEKPEAKVRFQSSSDRPEAILKAFGMISQGRYTNAADVCFGKDPSIRNPQVRLRAFAFEQNKRGDYRDHRDIHGPLAKVIDQAVEFVGRNSSLAARFPETSIQREVKTAYPSYAIREGIVNAVAHRDYASFSSGATIMLYPDRLEIWNSGALPEGWNPAKLKKDHLSLPKNPDIAHYLYVRLFMERIGRGTQKILDACKQAGLKPPTWKVDEDGITLILYSTKPKAPRPVVLNERMRQYLRNAGLGQPMTTLEYTRIVEETITERQARRDLGDLVKLGYLTKKGRTKAARYIRTSVKFQE